MVKIPFRKGKVLCTCAIPADNPQDRSVGAVIIHAGRTIIAVPARTVNLAHNSFPDQRSVVCSLNHPHKFMARNSLERHIALCELNICLAYPGQENFYKRLFRRPFRHSKVMPKLQFSVVLQSFHGLSKKPLLKLYHVPRRRAI